MVEEGRSSSPPPCPATVTVRRNPHRKARATPCTSVAKPPDFSSAVTKTHDVPSFPIEEILSIEVPQSEPKSPVSENLKVFLRIKPLKSGVKAAVKSKPKNAWPQNLARKNSAKENRNPGHTKKKNEEACITVNDSCSVTLTPPSALQELKRSKTEVYEGFSYVFSANSSQNEVYEKMVNPLLEDFLRGKSGMLAAMGPSGSGKTHTVFGNAREPGMVRIILRQIFKRRDVNPPGSARPFYLSIFEIYSERGKGERASDLLGDGGFELSVQQSTIKGIQEALIRDVKEAETLIGQAMLKRATAMTNSNSQSSRSQCIINLRAAAKESNAHSIDSAKESKVQPTHAVLTIVDLAGAEREKKTGNQGGRLVESNFINNTSMVFGQCLRSLLEYQKNRKKAFQKHFQNSLLTRYLRDYLEGRKRMALILTVKAGEEDYLDTSLLLKQASPYMKIKFDNADEPCNKRQLQAFPRAEQSKKIKISALNSSGNEEATGGATNRFSKEARMPTKKTDRKDRSSPPLKQVDSDKNERDHIIMRNFAKVLWSVLKQYNAKLKIAECEIGGLKENLRNEQLKSLGLERELISLKSSCLCSKQNRAEESVSKAEATVQAKEQFEVDASLVNEVPISLDTTADFFSLFKSLVMSHGEDNMLLIIVKRNVDDGDSPLLIERESNANAEGNTQSPVPRKDVVTQVKDAALLSSPRSSDHDEKPRVMKSDATMAIAATSSDVEAENFEQQRDHGCDEPAMAESEGSTIISSPMFDIDRSNSHSSFDLALQTPRGDKDPDAFFTFPKDKFDQECDNGPPNIQAKSGPSHTFPNSEKPKRELMPMSSALLVEELGALNGKNETENSKDKTDPTLQQKLAESTRSCNIKVPDSEAKPAASKKRQHVEKPKRRLLPASSLLLTREMNILDIEDEAEKPKGNRGGKKPGTEGQQRTQGSVTLLHLLKTNLHL